MMVALSGFIVDRSGADVQIDWNEQLIWVEAKNIYRCFLTGIRKQVSFRVPLARFNKMARRMDDGTNK